MDILKYPYENTELRAALCGVLNTAHLEIITPFLRWLKQLIADIEWYLQEVRHIGRPSDTLRYQEGCYALHTWQHNEEYHHVLHPAPMRWFRHLIVPLHDPRSFEDPLVISVAGSNAEKHKTCEEYLESGEAIEFTGTLAQLGLHTFYTHGKETLLVLLLLITVVLHVITCSSI